MHKAILMAAAGLLVLGAGAAQAQKVNELGQKGFWRLYSYNDESGKVCYTLTVPTEKQPPSLDHGKSMYFVVTHKPGQNVSFEPQFSSSYNLQENSKVAVTVDGKTFSMFTKGNRAWMENAAEEPNLIAAMRSGSDMKVDAKSGRGNPTSYVFSLKGISAALKDISACK